MLDQGLMNSKVLLPRLNSLFTLNVPTLPPPTRMNPLWPQMRRSCQTASLHTVPRLSQLTLFGHLIRMLPGGPRLGFSKTIKENWLEGLLMEHLWYFAYSVSTVTRLSVLVPDGHPFGQVYSSESTHLAFLLLLGCLSAWRVPDRGSYGHRESRLKEVSDVLCGNLRWL